ncbi:MAG: AAA family ATPase [Thioploca sp.]|nr:AAA family ATPase [Thioploca sp.]
MFKRIRIENFLSCRDILLDNLTGVIALIGRNGSGKTNILQAIQWAVNIITSIQPIKYTFQYPPPFIGFDILLDKEYFRYQLTVAFIGSSADDSLQTVLGEELYIQKPTGTWENIVCRQKDKIKVLGYDTEIQTGVATPSLPALIALIPQNPVVKLISKIINFFKAVRYYPLDEPNQSNTEIGNTGLVRPVDYEEWLSKYRSHPDPNTSVIMRLLHLFFDKKQDYEELKTLLGDNGLELITDIELLLAPDYPVYIINFSRVPIVVPQPPILLVTMAYRWVREDYFACSFQSFMIKVPSCC